MPRLTDENKKKEIQNDLKTMIKKHGLEDFRKVTFKYFRDLKEKEKLAKEIKRKETELEKHMKCILCDGNMKYVSETKKGIVTMNCPRCKEKDNINNTIKLKIGGKKNGKTRR